VPQPSDSAAAALRLPVWATALARRSIREINTVEATFAAGAALAGLDAKVRAEPAFADLWRRRLALEAACATLQAAGRPEDKAGLRDAVAFTPDSSDPGPAGRAGRAWRALADGSRQWAEIAFGLGAPIGDEGVALIEAQFRSQAPAPIAAAVAARAVAVALNKPAPALAFMVADAVLTARLHWPAVLPLLAPELQRSPAPRPKPGEGAWEAACCVVYARAAARACDVYAELARAEARLRAVAPKLRAKGASAAVAAFLAEDALTTASEIPGLSERGLRRLFDRLVSLGAVRELTGRPTFRLYGL
jgi:hypothetical protein